MRNLQFKSTGGCEEQLKAWALIWSRIRSANWGLHHAHHTIFCGGVKKMHCQFRIAPVVNEKSFRTKQRTSTPIAKHMSRGGRWNSARAWLLFQPPIGVGNKIMPKRINSSEPDQSLRKFNRLAKVKCARYYTATQISDTGIWFKINRTHVYWSVSCRHRQNAETGRHIA